MARATKGKLETAKRAFYYQLLENDHLARLIVESFEIPAPREKLDDFMVEPWRRLPCFRQHNREPHTLGVLISKVDPKQGNSYCDRLELLTLTRIKVACTLLTASDGSVYFNAGKDFSTGVPLSAQKNTAVHFMAAWRKFRHAAEAIGAYLYPGQGTFITDKYFTQAQT